MSGFPALFHRWILRPMRAEPMRSGLTAFAVALGVAVVVAIRLAGDAATGSFRSSMETLAGRATFEITATGGLDEALLGRLAALPHPLRFVPRMEGFAAIGPRQGVVPLIGLDLLAQPDAPKTAPSESGGEFDALRDPSSVWISSAIGQTGGVIRLTVNDTAGEYRIRGRIDSKERFVVMDIGAAQLALRRAGRVDRVEVHVPPEIEALDWQAALAPHLPAGATMRPFGSGTEQNRRMLTAFRWNLRILSYISLVVGAFLIYNTISVSVVRRRPEIGVVRAIGATRGQVKALFLGEAAMFGLVGSLAGLAMGRVMAEGAVLLLSATVRQLYVSSTPGDIALSGPVMLEAGVTGLLVSLIAALAPAREASLVAPVEAMARGRREYASRIRVWRDLAIGGAAACLAAWAATREAWDGRPIGGYVATFLLIFASALAAPAAGVIVARVTSALAARWFGAPGLLAVRGSAAALSRTSVLVAALATAVAMLVSVGIMVGSFRETVAVWMDGQLQADLYLRPAGGGGANQWPTLSAELADKIARLPSVRAIDRFRVYEISYGGLPALLGGGETQVFESGGRLPLLPGSDRATVLRQLIAGTHAIVSEPFANKHRIRVGDNVKLPFAEFPVAGIYHDYSNERGFVILDRQTLLRYLPDPAPSNLAVYLKPGADPDAAAREIESAADGYRVLLFSNGRLRREALAVFDRTFAVTWALEAVAIFVAVLGVAGALVSLVIDRRREIALLRFLGAAHGQIRSLILCEAGLLGLLANALGLALGYVLSLILIYVVNVQSFGWTIQFHWPVALLLTALTTLYLASVAAGLYPARVATKLDPIEAIHEE